MWSLPGSMCSTVQVSVQDRPDSGAFTKAIIPLSKEDYGSGNITLRINDSNGPVKVLFM